ncbi:MAG TPA: DUF503 domain-containing protein [Myxococcota bacterium]|nr:DUF503 domain-containing protein [Myxococcota bacterium]
MLVAAALIELAVPDAETIKARRRVARSVKDRIRQRFNVSVAEVADQDERHSVVIGCVMVGVNPRHLREGMEKVVRYVESLGLAEVVADDVTVVRLDEVEELDEDADDAAPAAWRDDDELED